MKRFKNILFVMNSKLNDHHAFERAVSLAENNQASLTVVSILDDFPADKEQKIYGISMAELHDAIIDKRKLQLEDQVALYRKRIQLNTKVILGTVFLALIQEVLRFKRDLLVKVAEKEERVIDSLFGSTDMRLLRKCPCPIWLMKPFKAGNHRKILAAVDFDPYDKDWVDNGLNRQILEMSISLAISEFCELHIVHVWSAYGEISLRSGFAKQPEADVDAYVEGIRLDHQKRLDDLLSQFIDSSSKEAVGYLKPKIHLLKGDATEVIPLLVKQQQIDFVMMGTVARTGVPGLIMGNSAEKILNQIDCSVLAVKPNGFVSPVTL